MPDVSRHIWCHFCLYSPLLNINTVYKVKFNQSITSQCIREFS